MAELKPINFSQVIGSKDYFEKTQVPIKKQLRFVVLKLVEAFGNGCVNKNNPCPLVCTSKSACQAKKLHNSSMRSPNYIVCFPCRVSLNYI